jgi:hypothetical protein
LSAGKEGLVGVLDVRARKTVLGILGGGAQGLLNNFFALVEAGRSFVVSSMGDDTVDAVGGAGFVGPVITSWAEGAACSL